MSAENVLSVEEKIASKGAPVAEKAPVVEEAAIPAEVVTEEPVEAASTEGAEVDENGKKRPGVHNRINELTKARREAERKADAAANEVEYWRQQAIKNNPPARVEPEGKRTLESFGFDQEAYLDYLSDEKAAKAVERLQEQARTKEQQAKQQERESTYQERVAAYEAAHPDEDYDETVTRNNQIPISQTMAEYIKESDVGPDLGVYFRDNPKEAKAIYAMSPARAGAAIARIEDKLSSPEAIPEQPVQITRAPPAPPRLNASASTKSKEGVAAEIEAVRARNR